MVDGMRRYTIDNYLELNRVTALLVLQDGKIRHERYLHGNTPRTRWMSMSCWLRASLEWGRYTHAGARLLFGLGRGGSVFDAVHLIRFQRVRYGMDRIRC
jgi:hypothetical protein